MGEELLEVSGGGDAGSEWGKVNVKESFINTNNRQ